MTGIEVNSEAYFPKLRNIVEVPKARGQYRLFTALNVILR